ncbi:MAG: PTS transporter subunit EIIC [Lactimicrobium sp.]|uniref:PTS sugar transporter subunit IIC n=1 Tax=Lactimicrobium sp. TaxID=2563780 RepID=UPI002F35B05F
MSTKKSFTDRLVDASAKFANIRFLQTIQHAFMRMLPITMIGGFASLFKGISIGGYQAWLQSTPLYSVLGAIYTFTVGLLAIYVVTLTAYEFASTYHLEKSGGLGVAVIALACFLIVTPYTEAADAYSSATLPMSWLGSSGMFTALIIAFATGAVFKFCEKKNLAVKLPDSVPPNIALQFTLLIPGTIAIILAGIVRMIFALTPIGSLQQAIYAVVSTPLQALGANIFGLWIIYLVLYLMWFLGIHGGMTVGPVITLLFTQLQMENLAAYQAGQPLPHMVTGNVLSYSSGSLPLVIAALIVCKSTANRSITKLGFLPSLFGVDEPMYFGFPMILNPMFFIPWVIVTPSIAVWGTWLLQKVGLLGYATGATAGSFVPFFVSNLVSYGIRGLIWGCIFFALDVVIYIPFVKAYDRQIQKEEAETLKEKEEEKA